MKKIFIIISILFVAFFTANSSLAQERHNIKLKQNENYLILLNVPTSEIIANDIDAIKFEILTTLYNEKNQITIKPLKEGNCRLYITLENNNYIILDIVTNTQNDEYLKTPKSQSIKSIIKIDTVEKTKSNQPQKEELKLDLPPILKPKLREAH